MTKIDGKSGRILPPASPFYLLWRANMPRHLLQVTSERFEEMAEGGENSPQYVLAHP
jgi:hypothetical protein